MTTQQADERREASGRRRAFCVRLVPLILLGVLVVLTGLLWSGLIVTPGPAPPITEY